MATVADPGSTDGWHRCDVEVLLLLVSPAHRYDGRPRDGPRPAPSAPESVGRAEVVAGRGLTGDRYSRRPEHADAAVTLIAVEALEAVAAELGAAPFDPLLTRRNVVLRGADVEALRGTPFTLDCGDGPVHLLGGRPAAPCSWMDAVLAPGAHAALRGRAGVRCAATSGGTLRVGPAVLAAPVALDAARAGQRRVRG